MRKWNAILSMVLLVLFLFHAIIGGFQLTRFLPGGNQFLTVMAWVMTGLILIHMCIGVKLTIDTILACKKSGVSYFRENKIFWLRRISGFAIFIFMLFHIFLFLGKNTPAFRLNYFGTLQLAGQLLLVLSIGLHVLTNIKPLMIALGMKSYTEYLVDLLLVLSVLLILMGVAFCIYFIRWQM